MDEELIVDPKFQKGFNHGYILATHEPELANEIVANRNEHSQYFSGLVSGKEEYDIEKTMERLQGINRNEPPAKNITKDKGKGK